MIEFAPRRSHHDQKLIDQISRLDRAVRLPAPNASQGNGPGQRMYQGAMVNRLTADWIVSITSGNAEILVSRRAVISRAQQLARDNPYAVRILNLYKNNVIGHKGIRLAMKIKDAAGALDIAKCKLVWEAWREFNKTKNFTVSKNLTGVQVQRMCQEALVRDGGILLRKYPGFKNDFRFAVEPIDVARLDHDYNRPGTSSQNEIQFGVEMDKYRAPLFYHILTRHPGDVFAFSNVQRYRERVPADEIIFLFDPGRPGDTVGMPRLASVMTRMNMMEKYDQAECVAAFIASCKGGFFEKARNTEQYEGPEDEAGNKISDTQPGQWEELPDGWKAVPNDPQHPTQGYPAFIKTQLRGIASGAGISYNALANDLEGVNYSSIRAGLLEDREQYKTDQQFLCDQMMEPLFETWLLFALMTKQVDLPLAQFNQWNQPCWKPRRWPWVDPLKDVEANLLEIEGKLTSRRRVISENDDGADIEQIFEEIEEDEKLAEKHGIDLTPDAVKPVVASGPEAPDGDAAAAKA